MAIRYRSLSCDKMTDNEIEETIELFGNHYGIWATNDNKKRVPGKNVKMPFIKEAIVNKPDRFIAMAYNDEKLIGYAYYMRRKTTNDHIITWILQLVVHKDYRGNGIGTNIMRSIWGMSDSWAWGLYTANPFTIKCLQDATMRKVKQGMIANHINEIKTVSYDLLRDSKWIDTYKNGTVFTDFPVEHADTCAIFAEKYPDIHFDLPENLEIGYEWFAFVFCDQRPDITTERIEALLTFSESITRDAYSKMDMDKHAWALKPNKEVSFVIEKTHYPQSLLDIGCGHGRHSLQFASHGIETCGIDNIDVPSSVKKKENEKLHFICADARTVSLNKKYDVAIALYDVIGSYPDEKDNLKILENAYKHLKRHGILIISVMNMVVTLAEVKKHNNCIVNIKKPRNARKFIQLKSSETMQQSGQVFDGRLIMVDMSTGLCYRKEMFFTEDSLPIEYIVVDRRYSLEGINRLVRSVGFVVSDCYCVQAGKFDEQLPPDDPKAKEILIVAKKGTIINKISRPRDITDCWK